MSSALRNKLTAALLLSIGGTTVLLLLLHGRVTDRVEWIFQDWLLTQHAETRHAPNDIAIILIDDASLQAMAPIVGRWPWPRSIYADVLEYLALGKPKAVIFDILFVEQQSQNSQLDDTRLADATRHALPTVHATQFVHDNIDNSNYALIDQALPPAFQSRFRIAQLQHVTVPLDRSGIRSRYNNYLAPISDLLDASPAIGVTTIHRDSDGIMRKTPLLYNYQDSWYPALSLAPLLLTRPESLSVSSTHILIDNQPLPLNAQGELILNPYTYFSEFSMGGVLASISRLRAGDVDQLIIDPDEFKDKFVFIGASAIGLNDIETTALGTGIPGVTLHATVLGNLLTHDFLAAPHSTTTLWSIFLLCLFTGLSVLLPVRMSTTIILPLGGLALFYGWAFWQITHNQLVSVASPLLAFALTWASAHSYLLVTEGREKRKVRRMFSQFVSPAALSVIVDQYENYAAAGSGSKETVSILFSDIRGFTSLSESLPAEKVVEILNYYFTEMTNAIHDHHGTIDKFIGDAIMAIWGAPIHTPDHPEQAVRAALAMVDNLQRVNQWLAVRDYAPINIGIGIHTGEVILGSIGSEYKADYTVIGDNVNLASRLEGITKTYGCQIIISETTHAAIADKIPCRIVDRVRVKGKQRPICIYSPLLSDQSAFSEANRQLISLTEQAFSHYTQQQWDAAIAALEQIAGDSLTLLQLNRCKSYQQRPPEPNWDGCQTMSSK